MPNWTLPWIDLGLLLIPSTYGDLYPRHLIMPYLMMAAAAIIALSPRAKRIVTQSVRG